MAGEVPVARVGMSIGAEKPAEAGEGARGATTLPAAAGRQGLGAKGTGEEERERVGAEAVCGNVGK